MDNDSTKNSRKVKPVRPRHDNVIYANFGAKKRVQRESDLPKRDVAAQLPPAAARLVRFAHARTDQGRISRGLKYAAAGNVIDMETRVGAVHARVAGSQNEPFTTSILLPYRDRDDLNNTLPRLLMAIPAGLERARRGDLDERTLDFIFGDTPHDLVFRCDCPDPEFVCKHCIAVVDRLAAKISADPSLIFTMRGMPLRRIQEILIPLAVKSKNVEGRDPEEIFWKGHKLPGMPSPTVAPALDDSDIGLLHKAMRNVTYTSVDELRAVSDIEELFDKLTR